LVDVEQVRKFHSIAAPTRRSAPSPPQIHSLIVALPKPDATATSPKSAPPQSGWTLSAPPRLDHVANARAEPRRHRPGWNTLPQPGQTERCFSDVGLDAVGTAQAGKRHQRRCRTTPVPPVWDHVATNQARPLHRLFQHWTPTEFEKLFSFTMTKYYVNGYLLALSFVYYKGFTRMLYMERK
jgi:hypothetical protein